jgi:hypothetical protein
MIMDRVHRRWWNGHYGRLARRDVVIFIDGDGWRVEAWEGGPEGRIRAWAPPTEEDCLLLADDLMSDSEGWRELPTSRQ